MFACEPLSFLVIPTLRSTTLYLGRVILFFNAYNGNEDTNLLKFIQYFIFMDITITSLESVYGP